MNIMICIFETISKFLFSKFPFFFLSFLFLWFWWAVNYKQALSLSPPLFFPCKVQTRSPFRDSRRLLAYLPTHSEFLRAHTHYICSIS